MLKAVSLIFSLFVLTACGSVAYLFHSELQKAPIGVYGKIPANKAVVVMGSDQMVDLLFAKNKDISRASDSQFRAWLSTEGWLKKTYYDAFVVDPGTYHLYSIKVERGRVQRYSYPRHGGMDIGTRNYTYLSFHVAAGDVKYIGNLKFDNRNPFFNLQKDTDKSLTSLELLQLKIGLPFFSVEIHDRFAEARDFLRHELKRPDLALTKDLARLGTHDHFKRAQKIIDGMAEKITKDDYRKALAIFDRGKR